MFFSQKQMMARNAASMADNPMAQQQKILLYVMPIFLAVISFQFPLGILLYWVTTNLWQILQQWIILRESTRTVAPAVGGASGADDRGSSPAPSGGARGATSGRKRVTAETSTDAPADAPAEGAGHQPDGSDTGLEKNSTLSPVGDGGTGNGTSGDDLGDASSGPSPASRRRLPKRGGDR
jgi:YidC/Oxa1 family membrane protein insertase